MNESRIVRTCCNNCYVDVMFAIMICDLSSSKTLLVKMLAMRLVGWSSISLVFLSLLNFILFAKIIKL